MSDLTDKQQRFVEEYLVDLNATKAAIRAGYSKKTAEQYGHQLLKKTSVAEAVAAGRAKLSARVQITQERVIDELAKIGFSDIRKMFTPGGNLLPIHDLDDDAAACLSSIEVVTRKAPGGEDVEVEHVAKIKVWDKRAALVDIGKHLGMFKEKVELTGKDGGPIQTEEVSDQDAVRWMLFEMDKVRRAKSASH